VPGFGLRIYPTGRKAFILRYRVNGSKRLLTLGPYGVLTLEQARNQARQRLGEVIGGEDPLEKRKKAAQGETMQALCTAYLERHAARKRSARDDRRRIAQHLVPVWGHRNVDGITRADVAALHTKIGERAPYEANRTVARLGKIFELARRWGFLPKNAANPARGIDKFKEQKRDRWVTLEELPRLASAIAQTPNLYVRAAIWLYLLTGVRREELLQAKWTDVDVTRSELRLSETKAGGLTMSHSLLLRWRCCESFQGKRAIPTCFLARNQGAIRHSHNTEKMIVPTTPMLVNGCFLRFSHLDTRRQLRWRGEARPAKAAEARYSHSQADVAKAE